MLKKSVCAVLIIVCVAGIVCIVGIVGLRGCTTEKQRLQYAIDTIEINAEIELPQVSKLLFRYSDNSFHPGRHEDFSVLEFENEPTDWLKKNNFCSIAENPNSATGSFLDYFKRGYFRDYFENEEIESKKIPKEFVPNFNVDYRWMIKNNIYFYYYPETLRLMVYIPWI